MYLNENIYLYTLNAKLIFSRDVFCILYEIYHILIKFSFFIFFSIPQNKTINNVNDKHRLPGSALEICCSSLKLGDIKESPFHMSEEKGFVATAMSVVSKYTV